MISQIYSWVDSWATRVERGVANQDELLDLSSQFTTELQLAQFAYRDDREKMEAVAAICAEALKASEDGDLEGIQGCLNRMRELVDESC